MFVVLSLVILVCFSITIKWLKSVSTPRKISICFQGEPKACAKSVMLVGNSDTITGTSLIEPLRLLDWKGVEPLQLRPYKPKYNLSMAVEKAQLAEMISIDKDFLDRLALRKEIIARFPQSSIQVSEACKPAVDEIYSLLVTDYLPRRYPDIFQIRFSETHKHAVCEQQQSEIPFLENVVSGARYPLVPDSSPKLTLECLAALVDEDFMFLLPSPSGYTLQGYLMCFSSGFASAESGTGMIGTSLSDLHAEVPGYKQHLEMKMERWIGKIKAGTYWKRCNWTVTMNGKLRNGVGENQVYDSANIFSSVKPEISQAHLRAEHQFMQRLPKSQAVLFSYKTYLYPLSDIKSEGNGPALAEAIEGLKMGNAPGMYSYKGAAIWGKQVVDYLRS